MVLIQSVASDEWWDDVTVPMLETVRKRFRALIKLIPRGRKIIVYTDFIDELGETMSTIDLPQVTAGLNMAKVQGKGTPVPQSARIASVAATAAAQPAADG